MNSRVLMTGFHFPPSALSSGHLRLLAFAKYLPEFGWDPVVLSATKCAYQQVDMASIREIPESCHVHRALALDVKRHLGLFGRYPAMLARPDRWSSWWPSAVALGWWLINRYQVQAIWSTYPVMTSHCVAYALNRLTGIPWIADFRDPVGDSVAGSHPVTVRSQHRWERRVVSTAAASVFTAPGAMRRCAELYPGAWRDGRLKVIENGYDELTFREIPEGPVRTEGAPLVFVHSGTLYPKGRDPIPFLTALARLVKSGAVGSDEVKVVLRASGSEPMFAREIQRLGLAGTVFLAPPVPNREALLEQSSADALLLFQGDEFDRQIPVKVYEYLRAGRPIFALVGKAGDTAALLRDTGGAEMVPPGDVGTIEKCLADFINAVRAGKAPGVLRDAIARYSRREGTVMLARTLDQICASRKKVAAALTRDS